MHKIKNIADRKDVECHEWEKTLAGILARQV
jgi:hypothetical protein